MTAIWSTANRGGSIRGGRLITVGAAVGVLALAGCGTGQKTQTDVQVAAVNGSSAQLGDLELRDVHFILDDEAETGANAPTEYPLSFVIANGSPINDDKLTGVTTEDGSVTLSGETDVDAGGVLYGAQPATAESMPNDAVVRTDAVYNGTALVPGLTYKVTFSFEQAGDVTVSVPVDAGAIRERTQPDAGEGSGHH